MALVKLRRALLIGGQFYKPGVQDIPDAALKHPHFVRYLKLNIVVAPDAGDEQAMLESPTERAKRILEREKDLQAKQQELIKKAQAGEAAPEDKKEEPPKSEAVAEEGKKKSKKG